MKADFQYLLSKYLTEYLKNECGASDNTIHSYRDTFVLLLRFFQKSFQIEPWKLRLEDLTPDTVQRFLDTIEAKGQTISTRNQRQAAIHSFIKYASSELPQNLDSFKKILDMPIKKASSPNIQYIKGEHIKLFLNVINTQSRKGYRDYMMMTLMLFCGLRVSEVICIKKSDISLSKPYTMMIHGKGNKIRIIPLVDMIADQLRAYLVSFSFCNKLPETLLFPNAREEPLSRQAVVAIVKKYATMAHSQDLSFPADLSPHCLRHSYAMTLLDSGVDLIYIRDLLGHASVRTTEIYARTDSQKRREAINSTYIELSDENPRWENNSDMLEWLKRF